MSDEGEEVPTPEGAYAQEEKQSTDPEKGKSVWGGWLSSMVEVAKEKSNQAVDLLRSDFSEFQQETSRVFSGCTAAVQEKLRPENRAAAQEKLQHGVTKLWGDFSNMMYTPPDEEDDDIAITAPTFSKFQSQLHAIQCDSGTYTTKPTDDRFTGWVETFDLEQRKPDISELLVHKPEVRSLYTRLVPSSVSHMEFWQHYYFQVFLLEQEESRKLELVRRADLTKQSIQQHDREAWDDLTAPSSAAPTSEVPEPKRTQPLPQKPLTERLEAVKVSEAKPITDSEAKVQETTTPTTVPASTVPAPTNAEEPQITASTDTEQPEITASTDTGEPQITASTDTEQAESTASTDVTLDSHVTGVTVEKELKVKDKGDMVVIGSTTPSADSSSSNKHDDEEDWEKEFDIEVTEEDMRLAEEAAQKIATGQEDPEDWEKW